MIQNTKRTLNQKAIYEEVILKRHSSSENSREKTAVFYLGAAVVSTTLPVFLSFFSLLSWSAACVLSTCILALWLILGIALWFQPQKIKNLEYYITENTCIDKTFRLDEEKTYSIDEYEPPHEHYYLGMEPHHIVESEHWYNTIDVGDHVYLLCSSKGNVLYIFNQQEWILDTSEFTQVEEGYYFPN